jgi:hypothetical protein
VSFDIGRSGTYSVYAKVYGKLVQGTPFVLEVLPEKYEIITTKQTITVGEDLEFLVKPLRLDSPSLQRKRINPLRETFRAQVTDKKWYILLFPSYTLSL